MRNRQTRSWAGPKCIPGPLGCRTTSPSTSSTPSASAARSWSISTGGRWVRARACRSEEPVHDLEDLLGIIPRDPRVPFDMREVLARVLDGSLFDEYKPLYGTSMVTGWGSIHGFPVGVVANQQGVIFSEEAHKATEFIQLCNRYDTPIVFVHNTTGYMVGRDYEQRGIIKDGAKMINAVANSTVPHHRPDGRRLLRGGQLRDERKVLQPPIRLRLAHPQGGGHGPQATRRGDVDHRKAGGRGAGTRPVDEDADAAMRASIEATDRARGTGLFLHRPGARRRAVRPPRHQDRARDRSLRRPFRRGAGHRRSSVSSGCDARAVPLGTTTTLSHRDPHHQAGRGQPGRDRPTGCPHRQSDGDSHRRCLLRTGLRCAVRSRGRRVGAARWDHPCRLLSPRRPHHRRRQADRCRCSSSGVRVSRRERLLCPGGHRRRTGLGGTATRLRSRRWARSSRRRRIMEEAGRSHPALDRPDRPRRRRQWRTRRNRSGGRSWSRRRPVAGERGCGSCRIRADLLEAVEGIRQGGRGCVR